MAKKVNGFLYWAPRISSILFILFLALFSLDVISSEYSLGEILIGLFMHNIPALALLLVLLISWKYEIVGGIVFILAGLLYIFLVAAREIGSMIIAGPALVIGVLFMINWFQKKKMSRGF
jgi:hypothetical protein